MVEIEPIPSQPAAVAVLPDEVILVIADYHAGFEMAMRYERGIELPSRASDRAARLGGLIDEVDPDRLLILGDLLHSIGGPGGEERAEVETLIDSIDVPVTLVKGNHDGIIEEVFSRDSETFGGIEVTDSRGIRRGGLGFVHGHAWPDRELLDVETLCIGHEHPRVRLTDEVGGSRNERVWLRGALNVEAFAGRFDDLPASGPELIVFPAFNELCGGTWVNVSGRGFLAPFLPAALPDGRAYLLDGTHLGKYHEI